MTKKMSIKKVEAIEKTKEMEETIAVESARLISEMSWFARKTQQWRSKYCNLILFSYDADFLLDYNKKAQRGLIKVETELELALRHDIKDWIIRDSKKEKKAKGMLLVFAGALNTDPDAQAKKEQEERDEERAMHPQLEDMVRTQSYLKTRSGPLEMLSSIIETCISNARFIAFFLMILAHLMNGALLTMIYPLAVFGYGLMEESRPQKWFWDYVTFYTLGFVFLRFATQFLQGPQDDSGNTTESPFLIWTRDYYIGLEPDKDGIGMVSYILCEIGIVCFANLAKMNQDLLGQHEKDEIDSESIT
jgi:hypothetical protein